MSPPKYTLVSLCSKHARTSLTLTPAQSKHVFAVAVITGVQEQTLYAESVETVQKDDKESLATTMRQEMSLAVDLLNHAAKGNAASWTDGISPLAAPSCRALGRSPTGPELEPFTPSPAKKARCD